MNIFQKLEKKFESESILREYVANSFSRSRSVACVLMGVSSQLWEAWLSGKEAPPLAVRLAEDMLNSSCKDAFYEIAHLARMELKEG